MLDANGADGANEAEPAKKPDGRHGRAGRRVTERWRAALTENAQQPRPARRGVERPDEVKQKIAEGQRRAWERLKDEAKTAGTPVRQGREMLPLSEITCICGGGDTLDHRARCPRGRAIARRRKDGLL